MSIDLVHDGVEKDLIKVKYQQLQIPKFSYQS